MFGDSANYLINHFPHHQISHHLEMKLENRNWLFKYRQIYSIEIAQP